MVRLIVYTVILLVLTLMLWPFAAAHADPCWYGETLHTDCTGTLWVLQYQGQVIPLGDMDDAECEAARAMLEPQTAPFTKLICVEVDVMRQRI